MALGRAPGERVNTTGAVAPDGRAVAGWTSAKAPAPGDRDPSSRTARAAALPAAGPAGSAVTLTTCATLREIAAGISDGGEGIVAYDVGLRAHVAMHDREGGPVGSTAARCGNGGGGGAAPRLTGLRVSPSRLRPGAGVRVSYRLSRPATVRFTVERKRVCPRRAGRGCRPYRLLAGSITRRGDAGRGGFRFRGRLKGRTLPAGRYRLIAQPRTASRAGRAVRRPFTISR
jgi:hypothetical protein